MHVACSGVSCDLSLKELSSRDVQGTGMSTDVQSLSVLNASNSM